MDDKFTIVVELPDETKTFSDASNLIDTYFENEVRNESIYIKPGVMLTTSSTITRIDTDSKRITIGWKSGLVEFAHVILENGCEFSYNLENDTCKEFVTNLNVGDEVILSGRIGEITRTNVHITGYTYNSEIGYDILHEEYMQ